MNITPRDIINASCCSPKVLERLKPYLPEYGRLIDEMLKYQDDDRPLPKNNVFYTALNLKQAHFTKLIKQFYDDATNLIQNQSLLGEGEIETELHFTKQFANFRFKYRFLSLPRIGDEIDFYFVKPLLMGLTYYYVDSVTFNLEASAEINVNCRFGSYNPYEFFKRYKEKHEDYDAWSKKEFRKYK